MSSICGTTNFDTCFKQATGYDPFPYQRALAEGKQLPELLEVPTGTGKTAAAILGWLWRRRFHSEETVRNATPRRLVYCLPMRVLVEQTRECAIRWLNNLGLLASKATFDGDRLEGYESEATFDGDRLEGYEVDWKQQNKIAVVTLMGGESQRDWREYPEREAIIVGTQDMLLSRALNRGFAMPPQEWPIDFGFLNVDALWVMDEVQLMGSGRTTSVQLQEFWDAAPPSHGLRRTLWMSATLGSRANSVELPAWMKSPERAGRPLALPPHRHTDDDLKNKNFEARWTAPKELELHLDPTASANDTAVADGDGVEKSAVKPARSKRKQASTDDVQPGKHGWTVESPELLEAICNEASVCDQASVRANGGRLVLVFVNQVKRACKLYRDLLEKLEELEKLGKSAGARPEVLLVHGRMRPHDRQAVISKLEECPHATSCVAASRVVVTTQVLEAGVDLDADALFTELCPWPSLVQRLGRLNRNGTRPRVQEVKDGKREPAKAVIFEPLSPARKEDESEVRYEERRKRERSQPYDAQAVEEARAMLRTVEKLSTVDRSLPRHCRSWPSRFPSKDRSSGASISTISSTPIRTSLVATRM